MIIDATNTILGRLATYAAKQALLGEDIIIINAEKAVVSGKKADILKRYKQKYARGVPSKGPFISRMPDRLVRRTIRGMIPYKTSRGREAYKRVKCYVGVPKEYEGKETLRLEGAQAQKLPTTNYMTIKDIAKNLGGSI